MKAYGGVNAQIHTFLTSALDGGEWSDSLLGHFTPGKQPPVPIALLQSWLVWTLWRRENS
jgi:hypothetical protein